MSSTYSSSSTTSGSGTSGSDSPQPEHGDHAVIDVVDDVQTPQVDEDEISDPTVDSDSPASDALEVAWENVTIKHGDKKLIEGVSGSVKGRFLAIMGGSGSGKTTLLNFLARRMQREMKVPKGDSMINGGKYTNKELKQVSGYVVQDDLLFANLTVEETLLYAARLRLPKEFTSEQRRERVDEAIHRLGLSHCRNTIIGDELKRGVSGGERKRVCVGVELLLRPNVLMLDEPTSGLDSASALSLCETLKNLATTGACTVICTIHQPQTKIFNLFDELIILDKGHVIYQGPADEVMQYYADAGMPCPSYTNPADHILDVITYVPGCDEEQLTNNRAALERMAKRKWGKKSGGGEDDTRRTLRRAMKKWQPPHKERTPWVQQYSILARRSFKDVMRSRTALYAQLLQVVLMGVLIGTVFLRIGDGQLSTTKRQPVLFFCVINQGVFGAMIVINSFPSERKIVLRERAAGSYYASAYYLGKVTGDLVLQLGTPIIFSCIVYWLVGLQAEAGKFFIFMAFMVLCSLSATSVALFISAVCRTTTLAVTILPFALELSRLFGGFFLPPSRLPGYFVWLDALSYAKFSYIGVSLNELQGLTITCTDAQRNAQGVCPISSGQQTIEQLGMDDYSVTKCALVLVLMIVVYRVAAYLAIRFIKW